MHDRRLKALFLCSRNRWRSPTAAQIWRNSDRVEVRARGLTSAARRLVTSGDIRWADVIFVMEKRHRAQMLERFAGVVDADCVYVLDIPDEYQFMDPELVDELRGRAEPVFDLLLNGAT